MGVVGVAETLLEVGEIRSPGNADFGAVNLIAEDELVVRDSEFGEGQCPPSIHRVMVGLRRMAEVESGAKIGFIMLATGGETANRVRPIGDLMGPVANGMVLHCVKSVNLPVYPPKTQHWLTTHEHFGGLFRDLTVELWHLIGLEIAHESIVREPAKQALFAPPKRRRSG